MLFMLFMIFILFILFIFLIFLTFLILFILVKLHLITSFTILLICRKAGQKMNALSRVIPYMNITKQCTLLKTFFISQFNYCPLIWMCHSHAKNEKINRLHERYLRIIYNDKVSTLSKYWKRIVMLLCMQGIFVFLR